MLRTTKSLVFEYTHYQEFVGLRTYTPEKQLEVISDHLVFLFLFSSFKSAPVASASSQASGQIRLPLWAYAIATATPDP